MRTARDVLVARAEQINSHDAERIRMAEAARRAIDVMANWDSADVAEQRATLRALLGSVKLVIEPRSKKNGSVFDSSRIRIEPVEVEPTTARRLG